jgi:tetratricopeptide (TPR) repeat protein
MRSGKRWLPRVLLYSALGGAWALAAAPPGWLLSQIAPPAQAATPPGVRNLQVNVLSRYLGSLPATRDLGSSTDQYLVEIRALPDPVINQWIEWMGGDSMERLRELAPLEESLSPALFQALAAASVAANSAPPVSKALNWLLNCGPSNPEAWTAAASALAARALASNQPDDHAALRIEIQRRDPARAENFGKLLDLAASRDRPGQVAAYFLGILNGEAPAPAFALESEIRQALARGDLAALRFEAAWDWLQPLMDSIDDATQDFADLTWSIATALDKPALARPVLESVVVAEPSQHIHWREIQQAVAMDGNYPLNLRRLARARLADGDPRRACEAWFHLAKLDPVSTADWLLQALPVAARCGLLGDIADLALDWEASHPGTEPLTTRLFDTLWEKGLAAEAGSFLKHLEARGGEAAAERFASHRFQMGTAGMSPLNASGLWRRFLRDHPLDTRAHHQLARLLIQAGQPRIALNHLLQTDPAAFDTALASLVVELALTHGRRDAIETAARLLPDTGLTIEPMLANRLLSTLDTVDSMKVVGQPGGER